MSKDRKRMVVAAAALGTAALVAASSGPVAAADFKGKEIQFIIGSRPGGGTDALARLVGGMLSRYLPGKPSVVFRNMPGGGGITAQNYFVEKVKPDGLTVLGGGAGHITPATLRKKASRFNPAEYRMWGGIPSAASIFLVHKDALARLKDKSKRPVVMGGLNGQRVSSQQAVWGPEYLGWNLRWVVGFSGSAALSLALERNEIQALAIGGDNELRRARESGNYVFISTIGVVTDDGFKRRPDYPDVPLFIDMVEPLIKSAEAKSAFKAWKAVVQVGKFYALPKGTSDDIVAAYRAAWAAMVKDPEFDKEAKRRYSVNYTTISGPAMERTVADIVATSDADINFLNALRKKVGIPVGRPMLKAKATLTKIIRGARSVNFKFGKKTHSVRISNSRTEVSVGGKLVSRSKLKVGMTCEFTYPGNKQEAKSIVCP